MLTPEAEGDDHQFASLLGADGQFFATGMNIREPHGSPNRELAWEVVFGQAGPVEGR